MIFSTITKGAYRNALTFLKHQVKQCHSLFGIKDLVNQEKSKENSLIVPVTSEHHELALDMIKHHYMSEHVLVRERKMNLTNDKAIDEYLIGLFRQGNTLLVKTEDDVVAGICVGFATSPIDSKNLRNYACYRQDPNTKEFLNFTAKMQDTPNLWELFQQPKIFEIKMLAVVPEYRRQGLAVMLVEKAKTQALDQAYQVIRMNCINPFDYKIAERCMMQCLVKFPLHKIRGANAPYIKKSSEHNCCVRVYVESRIADCVDRAAIRQRQVDLESLIE